MIDFDKIPTNEDWDNLIPGKYYPDNEYEDFYGKTYSEIVSDINNKSGIDIISSIGHVSSEIPFYFYTMLIFDAIKNKSIKAIKGGDDCFSSVIGSIETKLEYYNYFRKNFVDFIVPLKEILSGILDGSLPSDYDEEELAEIEERALALIAEIERRYADCIAAENAAAASIPEEG